MRVSAAGSGPAAFLLLRRRGLRATNPAEERILALIEPEAEGLGYRIVRVRLSGNRRKRLQVMAERASDGAMDVDDCARLSRALSPVLDLGDPIAGEYDLEVSSPGIDRPLMRLEDFERFTGHEAKLETVAMIDGRRRFKGVIAGVDGEDVRLTTPEGDELRFTLASLLDARLVLTDKLIEEDLRRAKVAQAAQAQEHNGTEHG
jgi:ribosome maturation factor RimP